MQNRSFCTLLCKARKITAVRDGTPGNAGERLLRICLMRTDQLWRATSNKQDLTRKGSQSRAATDQLAGE
jgi:hypothetical protein